MLCLRAIAGGDCAGNEDCDSGGNDDGADGDPDADDNGDGGGDGAYLCDASSAGISDSFNIATGGAGAASVLGRVASIFDCATVPGA
jgi:hypothetical protein